MPSNDKEVDQNLEEAALEDLKQVLHMHNGDGDDHDDEQQLVNLSVQKGYKVWGFYLFEENE